MRITVLGAGAWGTALARLLSLGGQKIRLWGHDAEHLRDMCRSGTNARYLAGIPLPSGWEFETDLSNACRDCEVLVIAVPSIAFKKVTETIADYRGVAVSVTKGIEHETGLTMSAVLKRGVPGAVPVALSGPTLAPEVARETPSAIVAASEVPAAAELVQELFHRATFRVYTSTDLLGVELGGALKNVIAIAAGVSDGLGFGDNSKAALVTRGIAEMRRLGVACGAQQETFSGLSGLGDLTVTCFSRLSRNRGFGERLGRGEKPDEIATAMTSVAEGVPTARAAFQLARRVKAYTPIIDEVNAMLYEGKDAGRALRDLTARDSKAED